MDDELQKKKQKEYEIVGELFKSKKLGKGLLLEILNNIEKVNKYHTKQKRYDVIELLPHLTLKQQVFMLNMIFGGGLLKNSFFKQLEVSFILYLLKSFKLLHVNPSEYVYSANMPANSIYLILEGRVNCIGTRNHCMKSYIKGSYFGDFEVLSNITRICGVRAEVETTLLLIPGKAIMEGFGLYPNQHHVMLQRTIKRYLSFNIAEARVDEFGTIPMNDKYWRNRWGNDKNDELHNRLEAWIEDAIAPLNLQGQEEGSCSNRSLISRFEAVPADKPKSRFARKTLEDQKIGSSSLLPIVRGGRRTTVVDGCKDETDALKKQVEELRQKMLDFEDKILDLESLNSALSSKMTKAVSSHQKLIENIKRLSLNEKGLTTADQVLKEVKALLAKPKEIPQYKIAILPPVEAVRKKKLEDVEVVKDLKVIVRMSSKKKIVLKQERMQDGKDQGKEDRKEDVEKVKDQGKDQGKDRVKDLVKDATANKDQVKDTKENKECKEKGKGVGGRFEEDNEKHEEEHAKNKKPEVRLVRKRLEEGMKRSLSNSKEQQVLTTTTTTLKEKRVEIRSLTIQNKDDNMKQMQSLVLDDSSSNDDDHKHTMANTADKKGKKMFKKRILNQ